jgi:hypothetical protein
MADREVFTLPDLMNQSGQADEYNLSPKGEGKRFWTQVKVGEFNTREFEIRPVKNTTPQKYQKWILGQPIDELVIAPNTDASVRAVNEVLKVLGKTLAIVPIRSFAPAQEGNL